MQDQQSDHKLQKMEEKKAGATGIPDVTATMTGSTISGHGENANDNTQTMQSSLSVNQDDQEVVGHPNMNTNSQNSVEGENKILDNSAKTMDTQDVAAVKNGKDAKNDCDCNRDTTDRETKDKHDRDNVSEQEINVIMKKPEDFIVNKDDPLHEEIISCISALDEVLAQFDDSSLPYITDFETSGDPSLSKSKTTAGDETGIVVTPRHHPPNNHNNNPQSVNNLVSVNDNSTIVSTDPSAAPPLHAHSSTSSATSLLLVNGTGAAPTTNSASNNNSKLVDQNQNLDWNETPSPQQTNGRERNNNNNQNNNNGRNNSPLIHASHLIQIPVVEPTTQSQSASSSASAPTSSAKQQTGVGAGVGAAGSSYNQKYPSSSSNTNSSTKRNIANNFHHSSSSSSSQTSAPSSPAVTKTTATAAATSANPASSCRIMEMNGNGSNHNKVTGSHNSHPAHHQQNNNSINANHSSNIPKKGGKGTGSSNASPPSGGGTYSKGTSYEILIPKITSGSFSRDSSVSSGKGTITTSSHSSRASIMVPVIESEAAPSSQLPQQPGGIVPGNVAKIRSQLNMGIFQPSNTTPPLLQQTTATHVPGEMARTDAFAGCCEVESVGASPQKQARQQLHSNNGKLLKGGVQGSNINSRGSNGNINNNGGNGVSSTYINASANEGKSSMEQSSSSGVSSAVAAMIMMSSSCSSSGGVKGQQSDDEQWNFPSEKNLPRSLRKTRKTCFLDEGDGSGKQGMGSRAESPFCCSESSNNGGMSSSTMDHSDHLHGIGVSYASSNGSKSPRMMPRGKGVIPGAKCEIINKGDGNFALAECSNTPKQAWNGQGASNVKDGRPHNNNRKKIYEDVILASEQNSGRKPAAALPISIIAAQNLGGGASISSPSSTFTSSSGVSLSVSGPNTFVGEEDSIFVGRKSSGGRNGAHQTQNQHQQPQQQQVAPFKGRARQQIPSPGGTGIPSPKRYLAGENQFIPLVYPNEVTMSSHQSPINSVEIGTEEEHHRDDRELDYDDEDEEEYIVEGDEDDDLGQISSTNNSPIKTCHPDSLMRNKSSDTDFEETASDSKILEKARRHAGKRGHSKRSHNTKHFEVGPNGSLPNQSQMMRMMMMMKSSNGKNNSVDSGSSSSRSSSSSGSVSVKSSSSSSDNNCGDVFHENIVQDYPTNIFNVGSNPGSNTAMDVTDSQRLDEGSMMTCDDGGAGIDNADPRSCASDRPGGSVNDAAVVGGAGGRRTVTANGAVVVLRGRNGGRGNMQLSQIAAANAAAAAAAAAGDRKKHGLNGAGIVIAGGQQHYNNQPHSTFEIDDGYLSMINRNEAPLLWPDEFVENETFSKAELRRLSVNLNDDTDVDEDVSSNSHSPRDESGKPNGEQKVKAVSLNKSNANKRSGKSRAAPGRSSTEKTDYFSDDSLEMEGDEDMLINSNQNGGKGSNINEERVTVVRAATSFVIPFHTNDNEILEQKSSPRKEAKSSQVRKSNSQVSRIPKPASSSSNNRRNSSGNTGRENSPTSSSPVKKPCSFFIPFSDTHGGSDMKLSSGENANQAPGLGVPTTLSSLRSTSLPSSRRNSSSNTAAAAGGAENAKQPVAWLISTNDDATKATRQQQHNSPQPDKASSTPLDTTYVVTDSSTNNNQSSDRQGASSSGKTSSSVTINNNNANNHFIATTSGVTVTTTTRTTGNQQDDQVLIVDSSNNKDGSAAAAPSTTTITCSANANHSAEGGGEGSMSKRHKFQKQQTFIVSPSSPLLSSNNDDRDISVTTSGGHGQRLIDPDEDPDNPSAAAASTKVTNKKDGDGSVRMYGVNDNDRMTTSTKLDNVTTRNPVGTKTTTVSMNANNDTDTMEFNQSQKPKQKLDETDTQAELSEVLSVWEQLSESTGSGGGTFKKCGSELNKSRATTSSVFLSTRENSGTTPKEQVSVELVSGNGVDNSGTESGKMAGEADNGNMLEGHASVSEELESVVKMFLKATEGLLDPEEEEEAQIGSENLKSSVPLGGTSRTKDVSSDDDHTKRDTSSASKLKSFDEDQEKCAGGKEESNGSQLAELSCTSFDEMVNKEPLMTSTPIVKHRNKKDGKDAKENSSSSGGESKRFSFLLVSDPRSTDGGTLIEDDEQPPAFIPDPPPSSSATATLADSGKSSSGGKVPTLQIVAPPHVVVGDGLHPTQTHTLDGKVTLDLLSQRITRNCPSPVENMSVSQFLHNKKNIWAMYDRPYDEDVLPPSFPRGYASRSQENLIDAMTHERLSKSFTARGQSSTLPLNCRPPPVQRRTSTFRNMFNKFRKHKNTDTVIPEGPEIRDEEAQSITSRETGPSEGKKRGFFSRLFRRSRKH